MSDVSRVREICGTVSDRAAKLAAAGKICQLKFPPFHWLQTVEGHFCAKFQISI